MIDKLLYEDKEDLKENNSVPDIYKISAEDMNKIKKYISEVVYVNENNVLSNIFNEEIPICLYNLKDVNTPVKTGRKVEDKWEYVIKIDIGNLPNNSSKSVVLPVSVSDIKITKPLHLWGQGTVEYMTEPSVGITYSIYGNSLNIITTSDRSRFHAYAELYFIYNEE